MPNRYAWLWMPSVICRIFARGVVFPNWVFLAEAVGWLLLVFLAIWWSVAERIALRITEADRNFSDRPAGLREFPLEIVIQRNDEEVGMDRGLAWFEDGLFYFNGSATSFVLSGTDLISRRRFNLVLTDDPGEQIRLKTPSGRATLRLMPLRGWNRVRFWYQFGRFLSEPPDRTASRQWPPFLPYGVERAVLASRSPEEVGAEAALTGSATGVIRG